MKVKDILSIWFISNNTEIIIRDDSFNVITNGKWYQDNISKYVDMFAKSFTYQDDDILYIDLFLC